MAQLGRRNKKDDATSEPESVEVTEVVEPTVEPFEDDTADDTEDDFDNLMAGFTNEENTDMVKQDVNEVQDAEVISEVTSELTNQPPASATASESALSDAAKEIADKATGHTVEMLEISSLPPTVPHIVGNLTTLDAIGNQIKEAVAEFMVGTGNKDEKVKNAIATLTIESDPENFERREAIAKAKALITELEEQIEADEPKLYEAVEERLVKEGDSVWPESVINEKRTYITDMYSGYTAMVKATESFIDSHRSHKPADKVGTIDQYHNKLDKPFKRSTSPTSGVRRSSGAPRNVSVSDARVSYDGGATWQRAEGTLSKEPGASVLSNPGFLAAEIARVSRESGNDIKTRLYSEWYGANGSADGSPLPTEDVQDVTEFDFAFEPKDGEDGVRTIAKVRITKKAATIEV